ncbi:MAG TPA: F0F1 ATP synthase subunit A [Anaerolineales bacterium]|nr:F0F1 ATP synthase subunit A [Anaerolineales bacterium]
MEQEKRRPWRRWVLLGLMIVGFILGGIFVPVQPEITAAPEKLIDEPLFSLPVIGDFYLVNTLPTLAVTVLIVIPLLAYFTNRSLTQSTQTDLVPSGIGNLMESILEILYNMTEGAAGKWVRTIFPWFATIMIYVLLANLLKLIPGFESIGVLHESHGESGHHIEPLFGNWWLFTHDEGEYILAPFFRGISVDLNFTVALALVAVLAVQVVGFRALGFGYLKKFFNFGNVFKKPVFGVIDMFMGLLELVSELSRVLSFAFRLFGNMFAGIVLVSVVGALLGRFSIVPAMIFMFELFVGVIQAFVFGILTMVFMVMATHGHGEEHAQH